VRRLLVSGMVAVKHAAALLGVVTHAANNHKVPVQRPDGSWSSQVIRDAQQTTRPVLKRRHQPLPPPEPATQPAATVDDLAWDRVFAEPPQKRPRTARAVAQVRRRREQDAQTQRRVNEIAGNAKGGEEHSAQQRLDGVRSRVLARVSANR